MSKERIMITRRNRRKTSRNPIIQLWQRADHITCAHCDHEKTCKCPPIDCPLPYIGNGHTDIETVDMYRYLVRNLPNVKPRWYMSSLPMTANQQRRLGRIRDHHALRNES